MKKNEINKIIQAYKPNKGFFDLSVKPVGLDDGEYASILNIQNFLAEQNKNIKYLMKYKQTQFRELQEMSGHLQGIIFRYWGNTVFNN